MIMRLDRPIAEIPPPADPDPDGASVVQELLGGKLGEETAQKLRKAAGLPKEPTGEVAG